VSAGRIIDRCTASVACQKNDWERHKTVRVSTFNRWDISEIIIQICRKIISVSRKATNEDEESRAIVSNVSRYAQIPPAHDWALRTLNTAPPARSDEERSTTPQFPDRELRFLIHCGCPHIFVTQKMSSKMSTCFAKFMACDKDKMKNARLSSPFCQCGQNRAKGLLKQCLFLGGAIKHYWSRKDWMDNGAHCSINLWCYK
jgi:hypothetical protein